MPPSANSRNPGKRPLVDLTDETLTEAHEGPNPRRRATGHRVKPVTRSKPVISQVYRRRSKVASIFNEIKSMPGNQPMNRPNASNDAPPTSENCAATAPIELQDIPDEIERFEYPYEAPPRMRHGPNGELFIPSILPLEALKPGKKSGVFPLLCPSIDDTPGRLRSTNRAKWWTENRPWLEKHAKDLQFDELEWTKKAADSYRDVEKTPQVRKEIVKTTRRDYAREQKLGHEDFDWVCVGRPQFDRDQEHEKPKDARLKYRWYESHLGDRKGLLYQRARQNPDWRWVTTLRGAERLTFWKQELMKRDGTLFGMIVSHDFEEDGIKEVIQNQILAFDKAFRRNKMSERNLANAMTVWAELESLAYTLNTDDQTLWTDHVGDFGPAKNDPKDGDAEGVAGHVVVIGHAVLNTVALIIGEGEFKPDSRIVNLGTILALFVRFVCRVWKNYEGAGRWACNVVALADKHRVDLRLIPYLDDDLDKLEKYGREEAGSSREFGKPTGTGKPWDRALLNYKESSGRTFDENWNLLIGGDQLDITRMTKAGRLRYHAGRPDSSDMESASDESDMRSDSNDSYDWESCDWESITSTP